MTREVLREIILEKIDQNIYDKVQQNWDALAKPLDSLGEFETTFAKIGAILSDETVPLEKKQSLSCARTMVSWKRASVSPGRK